MKKCSVSLFLGAILFLSTSFAFASVKPSDIANAVESGNLGKAESLSRTAVAEHPESAKAHYLLGEVLARENQHREAYSQLSQAKDLDPSLRFAKNPSTFLTLLSQEGRYIQTGRVESRPQQGHTSQGQATYQNEIVPPETHAFATFFFWFFTLALIGGAAFLAVNYRNKKKAANEKEAAIAAKKKEQMSIMVAMVSSVTDLKLEAKMASYSEEKHQAVNAEIGIFYRDAVDALQRIKDGEILSDAEMDSMDRRSKALKVLVKTGEQEIVVKSSPRLMQSEPEQPASSGWGNSYTPPTHRDVFAQPQQPVPAHQPVIINNSDGGFLTGMVMGSMMGGHHDREIIHEREVIREIPREPSRSFDRGNDDDSFTSPARTPDFDSGSGSNDFNDSDPSPSSPSSSDDDNF